MARPRSVIPKLCFHKPSNQAYVYVREADGRRKPVYLGEWGSAKAEAGYKSICEALTPPARESGELTPEPDDPGPGVLTLMPPLQRDFASGMAFVGRGAARRNLGVWGTVESVEAYLRLCLRRCKKFRQRRENPDNAATA
jgi:hypothetical protein